MFLNHHELVSSLRRLKESCFRIVLHTAGSNTAQLIDLTPCQLSSAIFLQTSVFPPIVPHLQVEAVEYAERHNLPVTHPLLSRVRACSTTPDAAAAFFVAVLHPTPSARLTTLQALDHVYLKRCVQQMQCFHLQSETAKDASCVSPEVHSLASAPLPDSTGFFSKLALARSKGFRRLQSAVTSKVDELSEYFPDYVHAASDAELAANSAADLAADSASDSGHSRAQLQRARSVAKVQPPASKQHASIQIHASANPAAAAATAQQRQSPVSTSGPAIESASLQQQSLSAQQAGSASIGPSKHEPASEQSQSVSGQQAPAAQLPTCTNESPVGHNKTSPPQQLLGNRHTPSCASAYNEQHAFTEASSSTLASPLPQTDSTVPPRSVALLPSVDADHSVAVSLQSELPTTAISGKPNQAIGAATVAAEEDASFSKKLPSSDAKTLSHRSGEQGQGQELPSAVQGSPATQAPAGLPSAVSPGPSIAAKDKIGQVADSDAVAAAANTSVQPEFLEEPQDTVPAFSGATAPAGSVLRHKTAVTISSHPVEILPQDEEAITNAESDKHLQSHPLQLSSVDEEDLDWAHPNNQHGQRHENNPDTVAQGADGCIAAAVLETASAHQWTSPYLSCDSDHSQAFRQPASHLHR